MAVRLLWLAALLLLASAASAVTVDESGEAVVADYEDAPPEIDPPMKEEVRVDPATGARRYDGYRVVRTMPDSQEHLDILRFIANGSC